MKIANKKDYIWTQFYQLLLKKENLFSTISVQDICKASGIHRSTFYRLFKDKYELLEFGIKILWKEYTEIDQQNILHKPFQTANSFYRTSEARVLILHHINDEVFNQFITHYFLSQFEIKLKAYFQKKTGTKFDIDLMAKYVLSNINVLEDWNRSLINKKQPAELDALYGELVLKSIGEK